MNFRYLSLIAYMLCTFTLQAANYQLSDELDFSNEGWNKVLQTSDGNTILFHFEHNKSVLVKVFDSDRKEIANEKFLGKVIDLALLEQSEIHGVYEIGSEAVIFMSQLILKNNTLVALRFNKTTGKIIKEQTLIASARFKARNTYSLVQNSVTGGYAVFCMKNLEANFKEKLQLIVFDEYHNQVLEVPVEIETSEYDYIEHVSTSVGNDGAYAVTLLCNKIIKQSDVIDRDLALCQLPNGAKQFNSIITKLPESSYPNYTMYSYNAFGEKLNLFLVNAMVISYQVGLEHRSQIIHSTMMLMYPISNFANLSSAHISHTAANEYLKKVTTDTSGYMIPIPTRIYTNKYGLTTMISEESELNLRINDKPTRMSVTGNITITHINDEGKEIWATVLPKQHFINYEVNTMRPWIPTLEGLFASNPPTISELQKRETLTKLFRTANPHLEWLHQFVSYKSIMRPNGDCYVIYNDLPSNFNKTIATGVDSVYSESRSKGFENTNAIFYKITRKREVTKERVFDASDSTATYAAMIEGSDYNETTQSFACVLLCRNGNEYIQKLGWRKLDD